MIEIDDRAQNWCFFDLETTGIDKEKDGIVQIALSRMVNGVSHAFKTLVNPLMPIPAEATAVHHITDDMVADAPTLAEIAPKIIAFFKGSKGNNPNSTTFTIASGAKSGCRLESAIAS